MLKIFKIAVTGFDNVEDVIGLNTSTRATIGYTDEGGISVRIEKVILPSVPTTESIELRDQHTTATYETILERVFTVADFPKTSEFIRWHVDYDVENNEFVGPFNALEMTKSKITNSQSGRKIGRFIKERYNENLIPLFAVDSPYKSATGFEASVLTLYVDENGNDLNDTVLTGAAAEAELVTQQEKEFWLISNINTNVFFEVLDSEGKILSTVIHTTKPTAKSESFVEMVPMNLDPDNTYPTDSPGGNQYKVTLPVADTYNVRIIYTRHLGDHIENGRVIPNTFDINCVNGVCNKTRSEGGLNKNSPAYITFDQQHTTKPAGQKTCSGVDNVKISTNGLVAGDYIKMKLDLGEYKSYAELWIELV